MSKTPRITIEVPDADSPQEVFVYVNPEGINQLISDLKKLSEDHDHFHLFSEDWGGYDLSTEKYDPKATTAKHLKVMFRPDEWDKKHFPHVMPKDTP